EGSGKTNKKVWVVDESQIVTFETAQAVGRFWTISGQRAGLSVSVTTFMDRASPAVFQRVQLANETRETRLLALDLQVALNDDRSYAGAGTVTSGALHTNLRLETIFGATIQPWQVLIGKTETTIRYALPVLPGQSEEFCIVTAAGSRAALDHLLHKWREAY